MKYLLDSTACVAHLRSSGDSAIRSKLLQANLADIAVCSVVIAELRFGALRSARISENLARVDQFVRVFPSLPFDDKAAEIHAGIRAELMTAGLVIGPYDSMIAAIGLAHDLIVVTHNNRDFSRVTGLAIEDWE